MKETLKLCILSIFDHCVIAIVCGPKKYMYNV